MSLTLAQILEWSGGRVVNSDDLIVNLIEIRVDRPAPLLNSRSSDLSFFFAKEYQSELPEALPGVLITGDPFVEPLRKAGLPLWKRSAVVACSDPYWAMAELSGHFAEFRSSVGPQERVPETQIAPQAFVHETARIGVQVRIGPGCVVEAGAVVGDGTILEANCYIGRDAEIGKDCRLFPSVVVYEQVKLGDRVRVHANTTLGSDGFGYAPIRKEGQVIGHQKIYHLGRVRIGNDVEIGASSTVDRGTMGDTVIESQVKLDNQTHVGHNAFVSEGAVVCGGACLAGNAKLGRFSYVGGLTGIGNHVHVGDGSQVGAVSLMTKDVPPGEAAVGNPQRSYKEHFQAHALLNRLLQERKKGNK